MCWRLVLISEVKVVRVDAEVELPDNGRFPLYHSSREGVYGAAFLNLEAPKREGGAILAWEDMG